MFTPNKILYEEGIANYELGIRLLKEYREKGIPCIPIENHNNIPEMRSQENSEFPKMKQNIIIGIRKTHKYVPNLKSSDFLVPYTSSGCSAMCLYCYLVCHYNKCSYLRLFVNREEILGKLIKTANNSEKELTFEIGSNSDLVLENGITGNLEWTIENFSNTNKGFITFPTKFHTVEPLLNLQHKGKVIIRMSVNPQQIISHIEFGTSSLKDRIMAINKLKQAGYKVGILIAPVIMVENWKALYTELIEQLEDTLSEQVKSEAFFEIIFMTYSYVHRMINKEAFPNAIELYDNNLMTGRGMGKYAYRDNIKEDATQFIRALMAKHFSNNVILYIV